MTSNARNSTLRDLRSNISFPQIAKRAALWLGLLFTILFLVPKVGLAQTITVAKGSLHPVVKEVLLDILHEARLSSVVVTSVKRSARDQARIMYELLHIKKVSAAAAKKMYSKAGDAVINVYVASENKNDRNKVISAMEKEVKRQIKKHGGFNRKMLMHVGDTVNFTFDLAPSSVKSHTRLKSAIRNHPDLARYFFPGKAEKAYHLEISKSLRTLSGNWRGLCVSRYMGRTSKMLFELGIRRLNMGYKGFRKVTYGGRTSTKTINQVSVNRKKKVIQFHTQSRFAKAGHAVTSGTFSGNYTKLELYTNLLLKNGRTITRRCHLRK